jgi:hypothetical protein
MPSTVMNNQNADSTFNNYFHDKFVAVMTWLRFYRLACEKLLVLTKLAILIPIALSVTYGLPTRKSISVTHSYIQLSALGKIIINLSKSYEVICKPRKLNKLSLTLKLSATQSSIKFGRNSSKYEAAGGVRKSGQVRRRYRSQVKAN